MNLITYICIPMRYLARFDRKSGHQSLTNYLSNPLKYSTGKSMLYHIRGDFMTIPVFCLFCKTYDPVPIIGKKAAAHEQTWQQPISPQSRPHPCMISKTPFRLNPLTICFIYRYFFSHLYLYFAIQKRPCSVR